MPMKWMYKKKKQNIFKEKKVTKIFYAYFVCRVAMYSYMYIGYKDQSVYHVYTVGYDPNLFTVSFLWRMGTICILYIVRMALL